MSKPVRPVLTLYNQPQTVKICYTTAMKLRGKSIGSRKCAHGKALGLPKRTILVAGMGTSPAVLTETVWALAHQEQPVVPDEVAMFSKVQYLVERQGKSDR